MTHPTTQRPALRPTPKPTLREDQVQRYARHILLPDVGGVGQMRLLAAAVAVDVGPGRAAEIAALAYLAGAGVGCLVLGGDADGPVTADEARDGILLGPGDIGRPRIDAVGERVRAINPDVRVERAGAAGEPGVPLAPAPALPAALAGGERDADGAVADALIHGSARAIRTLAWLSRPTRPNESETIHEPA